MKIKRRHFIFIFIFNIYILEPIYIYTFLYEVSRFIPVRVTYEVDDEERADRGTTVGQCQRVSQNSQGSTLIMNTTTLLSISTPGRFFVFCFCSPDQDRAGTELLSDQTELISHRTGPKQNRTGSGRNTIAPDRAEIQSHRAKSKYNRTGSVQK